jgi:hypothetical protein
MNVLRDALLVRVTPLAEAAVEIPGQRFRTRRRIPRQIPFPRKVSSADGYDNEEDGEEKKPPCAAHDVNDLRIPAMS